MPQNPKNYRLNGLHPLAYMGVNPPSPADLTIRTFPPTQNDSQNFQLGATWLVPTTTPEQYWVLVNLEQGVATWVQLYPGGGGGGAGAFPTDSGTATQVGGVLNVLGGNNINTSAPGMSNTVQIQLDDNVDIPGTLTLSGYGPGVLQVPFIAGPVFSSAGTDGQVLIGATVGNASWASLTAGANITITPGANSITIAASGGGGGGITTLTANTGGSATASSIKLQGNNVIATNVASTSEVDFALTNGTNGQVIIGGGANPIWANLTAGTNISITNGANSITINSTGGTGGLAWTKVTADTTMAINTGYICNKTTGTQTINMTLPATAPLGSLITVVNMTDYSFLKVLPASSQTIIYGQYQTVTGGGGGAIVSYQRLVLGDSLQMVCVTANTTWLVYGSIGNFNVTTAT